MNAPTSEWLNEAIDQAWKSLNAPQNETVTSKWYFKQGYLYGQASRNIRLPSEDELLSEYFTWSETKTEMALANCPSDVALWALEYIKRLNAGAAFKTEGES